MSVPLYVCDGMEVGDIRSMPVPLSCVIHLGVKVNKTFIFKLK